MYNKRIAIIDLTKMEVKTEQLPEEALKENIGGILINQFFYERFSAQEPIIIGTGPLTGTLAPASSVVVITAKSPLTNKLSHVPLMWHIGSEIKYSGFDFIIILGRINKESYLWFHDEIAEICDGTKLKELNVKQTVDELRKELGDENIQAITIGEAGRKGSLLAMLSENYWGSRDTLGLGAVFGKKNIIACAFRGLGTFSVEQSLFNEYLELRKKSDKNNLPQPNILNLLMEMKASQELSLLVEKHLHRNNACFNCSFNCYAYLKFREDPKILKSTDTDSPGIMLTSPLSASMFYEKANQNFFELYDEALLAGIEPGLLSLFLDNEIREGKELAGIINESAISGESVYKKILDSLKIYRPELFTTLEKGIFPISLVMKKNSPEEWEKTILISLISGICPVFLLNKKELKIEIIVGLLRKVSSNVDLNLESRMKEFIEKL